MQDGVLTEHPPEDVANLAAQRSMAGGIVRTDRRPLELRRLHDLAGGRINPHQWRADESGARSASHDVLDSKSAIWRALFILAMSL